MDITELNDLKCAINNGLANYSYTVSNNKSLYLPCNKGIDLRELFLYAWCINDWEQNDNGTTTGYYNYIVSDDLENIFERINSTCGC